MPDPVGAGHRVGPERCSQQESHDFGVVARGAAAEFDFVLENIYKEEVHIANVRSSCGCVTPSVTKNSLKTWEKAAIHAKFNTRTFLGKKNATITVTIDQPFPAEVQLTVSGFIRQDVVFSPGEVEFGELDAGTPIQKTIAVNYAGRDNWAIRDVETPSEFVRARWRETQRERGRVGYEMQVRLTEDAPTGYLHDQLVIITNDQQMERIPLTIQGRILPSITVSPSSLALGFLEPGQRVTKRLLIKGSRPFRVTDVHCEGDCLTFEPSTVAKAMHFVPITITAGDEPGDLAINIQIETDLGRGAGATCMATATVRLTPRRIVTTWDGQDATPAINLPPPIPSIATAEPDRCRRSCTTAPT